uniref:Odorant receptor n=1 Tax=Phlebotomus papatasi TaxID=29031 RepID=A0A3F2ZE91_PHLPP
MPVQQNLEIFNKIKPILQFGISIATYYPTTEPLWQRFLIKTQLISTILGVVSTIFHIANTFDGQFTGNLAMSLFFFVACVQVSSRTLLMRYHRNNVLELLDKVQSLHNNFENKELNAIAEKNLIKFSNIWATCFKIGKPLVIVSAGSFIGANVIKGKSGVLAQIPLFPNNFSYFTEFMLFFQSIFGVFATTYVFYTDLSIAFFGLEIMAASDILYDYISANKDRIQEDPDFLRIITMRYCEVVDNIERFNNIISITNLVQFVTSAFLSFAIFFFICLNPGYLIEYTWALIALIQLFIPCVFGEFIKIKMERLSTTLYLTNWPDLSLKDQNSFLIVLGMTQREYGIKAAGMYDVNIYTFIQIVKMAASWCTFIFTLEITN